MAINGRKISSFSTLGQLTGEEYLMVAYKGKTYKIPTELLISNMLESMTQVRRNGDGEDNPITVITNDGTQRVFHVYNGQKGSEGDEGKEGPKGERGDSGIAIYNYSADDIKSLIVNSLDGSQYSDEELTERMLSAAQGMILNNQIKDLKEVYFDTQEEFDAEERAGRIYDDTKYYIFEE